MKLPTVTRLFELHTLFAAVQAHRKRHPREIYETRPPEKNKQDK
jgi:hypothetical protein